MDRYISIDIETLGLDTKNCDVIEFGAVIDDLKSPLDTLSTFHCYILPNGQYRGEPYAMSMHADILRRIALKTAGYNYYHPYEYIPKFAAFADEHGFPDAEDVPFAIEILVAGKNFAKFDDRFLENTGDWTNFIKVKHRIIDPAMLYFDPFKDACPPSLNECLRRAGVEKTVAHTAIDDAKDVIRCLRNKWGIPY